MEYGPECLVFIPPKSMGDLITIHTKYDILKSGHRQIKMIFNNKIFS